jgi:fumarylacetoacetase
MFHATNVGRLFRPDNPLLPNYKHVPIAYHGRTSSLVISGTSIRRPWGQVKGPTDPIPLFRPSQRLDYETEVAAIIGTGNELGEPIEIDDAESHVFGLCLLNDWSARDIQAWEYQPLGPFLAKNFATSLSPWVVTLEALAPFRHPAFQRSADDPPPLAYLASAENETTGGFDVTIDVYFRSTQMRDQHVPPVRLSRGSFADMYWTLGQLVTHHTSNGCNLRPGDVIASGTISGSRDEARGCLLEITGGQHPLHLPTGEERLFLADGDEVTLHAFCERPGYSRVGFGSCVGVISPARIRETPSDDQR